MTQTPVRLRLGVNVDHVATLRQARGTPYPDPVAGARLAMDAGADSITVHLREDRRHIQDHDVERLVVAGFAPVNLEMAVTDEMIGIAERLKPRDVCLVPEKREERTTEGGLDIGSTATQAARVADACRRLAAAGCQVSLFIDADESRLDALVATGAPHLEIHTGDYADAPDAATRARELRRIAGFARAARVRGFQVHAGHGLTVDNVGPVAAIAEIEELNIGHALVARAVFVGLAAAIGEMRAAMDRARAGQARDPR